MNAAGSVLLDTSIVIAHLRGESELTARFEEANVVYLPWIVVGELQYGARRSRAPDKALRQIAEFQGIAALLFPTQQTIEAYSLLKAELAAVGTLIPENDVWIAALAREHNLDLATRDRHFSYIEGIVIRTW